MTVDLRTTYLGIPLANPLIASSSPLTATMDELRRLEDAGVAAVVLPSVFEEQISSEHDEPQRRLELVAEAKDGLSIPVMASLNGTTRGPWVRYARLLQEAGADAVELNIYFLATDIAMTSTMVELQYLDLVEAVRGELSIPLSVKLSPFFNAFAHMADLVVRAGADGIVMFNRFYQPDIDLDSGRLRAAPSPSVSQELKTALRWIAVLHKKVQASLAATGGIHTSGDALKVIAAGGNVAMMASALLIRGPDHIDKVLHGMRTWLDSNGYDSLSQLRGLLSHRLSSDPGGFERSMYMEAITNSLKDPRELSSFRAVEWPSGPATIAVSGWSIRAFDRRPKGPGRSALWLTASKSIAREEKAVGHKRKADTDVRADPSPRIEATAGEVMTTPAIVCRETTTLEELAELLSNREVSGVPVVAETGEVVGVVSEADFARAVGVPLIRLALKPRRSGPWLRVASRPHATQARDVMTSPPKVVSPDTPLHSVAEVMVTEGINRIPVVEEGRLLGVVTRSDLLAALAFMDRRVVRSHEAPIVLGPGALIRDERPDPSPQRTGR